MRIESLSDGILGLGRDCKFLPISYALSYPSSTGSHHIWLRDHCRCSECFHPTTMQRLLNTFEIPPNIHPISVSSTREGLKVVWPAFKRETEHEHESLYPWSWLKKHSYDPRLPKEEEISEKKILWGSRIAQSPPSVAYEDVMKDDKGLLKWLTNIVRMNNFFFHPLVGFTLLYVGAIWLLLCCRCTPNIRSNRRVGQTDSVHP